MVHAGDAPIDRYVVLEHLSEGGMGAIYVGKKLGAGGFEMEVVLKQLLPEFTQQTTMVVNRSAFSKAGVALGQAQTKNLKALTAAAKKLTATDSNGNLTRIGFDPKIDSDWGLMLWTKWFGSDVISKNGLRAQLNSKAAVAALTYGASVIKAEGGWNKFKAFRDTWDYFGRQNPLVKDQIGFQPLEAFFYNQFSNNSPDVDLLAKFFTNRKGGPISIFSGNGFVVPKAAKKRYDARKATGRTFMGLYTANAVADRKIYEDIYQSFGHPQFDAAVRTLVHAGKYGFELPPSPGGQQLVDAMNAAVQRVLTGRQTPRQALNQAQREAQAAINKNKG